MNTLKNIVTLMRPHQYVKNITILLPLFFSMEFLDIKLLSRTLIAFVAFSLSSSSVYILNDYFDIESDRLHPEKKNRPLAAGTVSLRIGCLVMILLLICGCGLMMVISPNATIILVIYVIMNVAYNIKLKHLAIVDIVVISTGFLLRLFVGSTVGSIPLSKWIVLMTFLLALFIAIGKRRSDVLIFEETGTKMRSVIGGYNLRFLDGAMMIMASVIIVAYILYTTSQEVIQRIHNDFIYLTTIWVIVGLLRYLQIAFVDNNSGDPTQIALKDTFLHITILLWIGSFIWLLYL
ncbi:MAG: decaprenyl-phosphate phosphoribosyltransferase [Clostridiaceae bacterium]|nr:decaprenyl-phosphate phosphoribosyltransferase [Clostridiaceae bacterium]